MYKRNSFPKSSTSAYAKQRRGALKSLVKSRAQQNALPRAALEYKYHATYSGNLNAGIAVTPNADLPDTGGGTLGHLPADAAPISASGMIIRGLISGIKRGTSSYSERIGKQITLKQIDLYLQLLLPTTTDHQKTADAVRVIFGIDNCPRTEQLNVSDVLAGVGSGSPSMTSPFNTSNSQRFKILYQDTFSLNALCHLSSNTCSRIAAIPISKKLNQLVTYTHGGDLGHIESDVTNHVASGMPFLLLISAVGNVKVSQVNTNVRYLDA